MESSSTDEKLTNQAELRSRMPRMPKQHASRTAVIFPSLPSFFMYCILVTDLLHAQYLLNLGHAGKLLLLSHCYLLLSNVLMLNM